MKGAAPAANDVINVYPGPWAKDAATLEKIRFERKLELSGEGHRSLTWLAGAVYTERLNQIMYTEW